MAGRRYLHLATHGYFAPPELKSAMAPPDGAEAFRSLWSWDVMGQREATGWFPELLSGLAWAGANRPAIVPPWGADVGAGIMTAEEVGGLDLKGCELAVLSACETGLGRVAGGEGVLGLQRAFHQAGCRTVVASLWRVDDAATMALMTRFYANLWEKGLVPLEALRQAQLSVLDDPEFGAGGDPRLWAAWTISGDPGALSQLAGSARPETKR
jgi:CHAT domain-containing protein